jgi:uncharacterized membrane protein
MPNTRLPNSIFFVLVLVAAMQSAYYAPQIPEILGSHFGKSGFASAWQTKVAFFATELTIIVMATFVSFGIPRILAAMPASTINLPNKDFWLSPERREDTFAFLRAQIAWLGCVLLAFLLFVMELVFRANLHTPPQLNTAAFVPALVAFLVFSTTWTLRLVFHFSRLESKK